MKPFKHISSLQYIMRPAAIILAGAAVFLFLRFGESPAPPVPAPGEPASPDDLPSWGEEMLELFPDARGLNVLGRSEYEILCADGESLGFIAYGPPEGAGITGYAGPVPFLAAFDAGRRVERVLMLPSRETPEYVSWVSEKLKNAWDGLTPDEARLHNVEAVTGATQTSRALIEGVQKTMEELAGAHPGASGHFLPRVNLWRSLPALLFLLLALGVYLLPVSAARAKPLLNVLSVLVPGLLSASILSVALFEGWLRGYFNWRGHWLAAVIAAAALGVPLALGKNFYCYNFCPFGAAQELMAKLSGKKWRIPKKISARLGRIRLLMIFSALIVLLAEAGIGLHLFEPFGAFRWPLAPRLTRALAVFMLLLSIKIPRPWCRVCPTGGLIDGLKSRAGRRGKTGSGRI